VFELEDWLLSNCSLSYIHNCSRQQHRISLLCFSAENETQRRRYTAKNGKKAQVHELKFWDYNDREIKERKKNRNKNKGRNNEKIKKFRIKHEGAK
jgi:hypothetical protein